MFDIQDGADVAGNAEPNELSRVGGGLPPRTGSGTLLRAAGEFDDDELLKANELSV